MRDDAELLGDRLGLVRGHRLDQTLVYLDEYGVADVTMSLVEGVGLTAAIEPELLPLLFELTPARPLRAAVEEAGLDPAAVVPTVRLLLERGLLEIGATPAE